MIGWIKHKVSLIKSLWGLYWSMKDTYDGQDKFYFVSFITYFEGDDAKFWAERFQTKQDQLVEQIKKESEGEINPMFN